MATGDNVLTAIHVGRECCIIDANTDVLFGDVIKDGDSEKVIWKLSKSLEMQKNLGGEKDDSEEEEKENENVLVEGKKEKKVVHDEEMN